VKHPTQVQEYIFAYTTNVGLLGNKKQSILVCKIFTFSAEIVDEIFGRNENWIFVYFPGKFSAKMRDTRTKFSFRSKISSTISAEIVGAKYHLLNHRF
jgi:hypothetical protein